MARPGRDRSARPAHADRPSSGGDVHDLTALGDLHRAVRRQAPGSSTRGGHQVAPAVGVDRPGRLGRADRRVRSPLVQQPLDRPFQPRVHVLHVPSLDTAPGRREPNVARRTPAEDAAPVRQTAATLLLSCLLVAAGLVVAAPASACSCAPQTTQQYFERADAVFTARLVSREEPRGTVTSSADPAVHVFAVDAVFKGTAAAEQEVLSPVSGATCGLELTGDGPFVVFATRSTDLGGDHFATLADDQYASLLCDGSAPATPALDAELRTLSTPGPPSPRGTTTGPTTEQDLDAASPATADPGPLLAVVGTVALLGVAALLVRRTYRRRRR